MCCWDKREQRKEDSEQRRNGNVNRVSVDRLSEVYQIGIRERIAINPPQAPCWNSSHNCSHPWGKDLHLTGNLPEVLPLQPFSSFLLPSQREFRPERCWVEILGLKGFDVCTHPGCSTFTCQCLFPWSSCQGMAHPTARLSTDFQGGGQCSVIRNWLKAANSFLTSQPTTIKMWWFVLGLNFHF